MAGKSRGGKSEYTEVEIKCSQCNHLIDKIKIKKNQEIIIRDSCPKCGVSFEANISNTNVKREDEDISLICPYCDYKNIFKFKKAECFYTCKKCHKEFKAISGIVESAKGLMGYIAKPVSIRIKDPFTGDINIISYYGGKGGWDLNRGDRVSIIFRKGILGGYGKEPHSIENYTAQTLFK